MNDSAGNKAEKLRFEIIDMSLQIKALITVLAPSMIVCAQLKSSKLVEARHYTSFGLHAIDEKRS